MEFDLAKSVAVLQRTPPTLRAMLSELPGEWINASEGPDTFTPYDVLGHLIHGERTDWMARARIILDQGVDRRFTPYDRFAQFEESRGKTLARLLDEFAKLPRGESGDARAMAKQYRDAVGPWREYLPIMDR